MCLDVTHEKQTNKQTDKPGQLIHVLSLSYFKILK